MIMLYENLIWMFASHQTFLSQGMPFKDPIKLILGMCWFDYSNCFYCLCHWTHKSPQTTLPNWVRILHPLLLAGGSSLIFKLTHTRNHLFYIGDFANPTRRFITSSTWISSNLTDPVNRLKTVNNNGSCDSIKRRCDNICNVRLDSQNLKLPKGNRQWRTHET